MFTQVKNNFAVSSIGFLAALGIVLVGTSLCSPAPEQVDESRGTGRYDSSLLQGTGDYAK